MAYGIVVLLILSSISVFGKAIKATEYDYEVTYVFSPLRMSLDKPLVDSYIGEPDYSDELDNYMDAERFFEINTELALAWEEFVKSCGDGDQSEALTKYIQKRKCKSDKRKLKKAKDSVKNYLINGLFPNKPEELFNRSLPIHTPIHPLFFQFVLEALAEGFPMPFAGYQTRNKGTMIRIFPPKIGPIGAKEKIVLGSRHWEWGILGPLSPKLDEAEFEVENMLAIIVGGMSDSNELPSTKDLRDKIPARYLKNGELTDEQLKTFNRLRLGFAADRLIAIMAILQPAVNTWGMWPKATDMFLIMMRITLHKVDSIQFGTVYYTSYASKIKPPLPTTVFLQTRATQPFQITRGSTNPYALDLLSELGAWRQLWHW